MSRGVCQSHLSERELLQHLQKTYSQYRALFSKITNPLSNLDIQQNLSRILPNEIFGSLIGQGRRFNFDPLQFIHGFVLAKMKAILDAPSLKDYLLSDHDQSWKKLVQTEFPRLVAELEMSDTIALKFEKAMNDFITFDSYATPFEPMGPIQMSENFSRDFLNSIVRFKALVELRAFMGLFDLCLVFSYQIKRDKTVQFYNQKLPLLVKAGRSHAVVQEISRSANIETM